MANKFALGLIAAGLVSAVGVNLYQAADRGRYVATTQAETVEYAPAPEVAVAPTPQPTVRSYNPVDNAMLQAARNNYHRCQRENGSDILGFAACEDAREVYEYARSQYTN